MMKLLLLIAFGMIATVYGNSNQEYLPPDNKAYLPPENIFEASQQIKKIADEYLPPPESVNTIEKSASFISSSSIKPAHVLADDGYHYKTPTHRHRRDVNDLKKDAININTSEVSDTIAQANNPANILMDNGYEYKTVRQVKYRHRRDVNELQPQQLIPENNYLPPLFQGLNLASASVPQNVVVNFPVSNSQRQGVVDKYLSPKSTDIIESSGANLAPVNVAQNDDSAHVLTNNGYEYKTVRQVRYRHRRDVNDFKTNEDYLPPKFQAFQIASASIPQTVAVNFQVDDTEPNQNIRSSSSYRSGKTETASSKNVFRNIEVNKSKIQQISKVATEYLPPQDSVNEIESSASFISSTTTIKPAHVLADDGYHYKSGQN